MSWLCVVHRPSRWFTLAVMWFAMVSTSCGTPRAGRVYEADVSVRATEYSEVLNTWTRSYKLYDRLDNVLFVTATYHAPEFRRAFALSFPEIYGHGGEVTRKELLELSDDVERFHTFFLVAFTPNRRWNDFADDDSIWRMTLLAPDGGAVGPASIEEIEVDQNLRVVYPYIGRFDKAYIVRFPRVTPDNRRVIPPEARSFTLRIASALGIAEPTWNVLPSNRAQLPDPGPVEALPSQKEAPPDPSPETTDPVPPEQAEPPPES